MRVVLDANVLISFLLSYGKQGTISRVVEYGSREVFDLLVPRHLIDEIGLAISESPYLRNRIAVEAEAELISFLERYEAPLDFGPPLSFAGLRDRQDEYLLVAAMVMEADYLVTGDNDLLVMKHVIDRPEIVTPSEFLTIIEPG